MGKIIRVGEIDFDSHRDVDKIEKILEENGYIVVSSGDYRLEILRHKDKDDEIYLVILIWFYNLYIKVCQLGELLKKEYCISI